MICITKEISFEMAHLLYGYDGPCGGIHGHSYKLSVTVSGTPAPKSKEEKVGVIMDFYDLEKIIIKNVISVFDHALVIWDKVPFKKIEKEKWLSKNIIRVPYQPTCENLVADFVERIKKHLPKNVNLISVKLRETPTSYAEWTADK
jgi:6-pyruvoyltetrahydropterin/6-carboxytetrahydropterin synthase